MSTPQSLAELQNNPNFLKDFLKNPDIIKQVGAKNIQRIISLMPKIDRAIEDPEFVLGEFKVDGKCWVGLLMRKKDSIKVVKNKK